MALAEIIDPETKEKISYYLDDRLQHNLKNKVLPALTKQDKDFFMIVDGKEGSGKSTIALSIGKFVDPTLNLDRVVFNAEDFAKAVYSAKKGQVIIFDEAFTGLSSRAALSSVNKTLVSLMMQMRQKNLMVIIVLPTVFMLDKYMVLHRAKILIHVYENKGRRGYFRVYNYKQKKLLYLYGKKDYSYSRKIARTNFKGRFYGKFALGDAEMEKRYRDKKELSLIETSNNQKGTSNEKYFNERNALIDILKEESKLSYRKLSILLKDHSIDISHQQVKNICDKFQNQPKLKEADVKD